MRRKFAFVALAVVLIVTDASAATDKHVDVGVIITKSEAETALGEPVKDPQPRNGDGADGYYSRCNYYSQNPGKSLVLRVHQSAAGKLDRKKQFEMLSAGTGKIKPLPGLGDRAGIYTSGGENGTAHVMMLYVAQGSAMITVGIGGLEDETAALEKAKVIARKILKQL